MGNRTSSAQTEEQTRVPVQDVYRTVDDYDVVEYDDDDARSYDRGLTNESNDCFANAVLQSLFHLDAFRRAVLDAPDSAHGHGVAVRDEDPSAPPYVCLLCALQDLFAEYASPAPSPDAASVLDPVAVRLALAQIGDEFAMAQMADATEALEHILAWMHTASHRAEEHGASEERGGTCQDACMAHSVFGMEIMERVECACGATSEPLAYPAFVHRVYAAGLLRLLRREQGQGGGQGSRVGRPEFGTLVASLYSNSAGQSCPGFPPCSRTPGVQLFLQRTPRVFTLAVDWPAQGSKDDIHTMLNAVDEDIDLRSLFYGLSKSTRYSLSGIVCYYGRHYVCFSKSWAMDGAGAWLYFDDERVRKVGMSWGSVVAMCVKGKLQPTLLFYQSPLSQSLSAQGVEPVPPSSPLPSSDPTDDELLAAFAGADCDVDFSLEQLRKLQQYEMAQYARQAGNAPSPSSPALPSSSAPLAATGPPLCVERDFVFGPQDLGQLPAHRHFDAAGDRWTIAIDQDPSAPGYLGASVARIAVGPTSPNAVRASVSIQLSLHPFAFGSSGVDLVMRPLTRWRDPLFLCPRRRQEYVSHSRLALTLTLTVTPLGRPPVPADPDPVLESAASAVSAASAASAASAPSTTTSALSSTTSTLSTTTSAASAASAPSTTTSAPSTTTSALSSTTSATSAKSK